MIHRSLWGGIFLLIAAQAQSPTTFRLPLPVAFVPENSPSGISRRHAIEPAILTAHPDTAPDETWIFTDRVALKLEASTDVATVLNGRSLTLNRTLEPGLYVLQAPDAWTAWREAEDLAQRPEVLAAYPVYHSPKASSDGYARAPLDKFFPLNVDFPSCEIAPGVIVPGQRVSGQWYLENRDPLTGAELGVDINVRPAWAQNRGEGITVAVADTGIELDHDDLQESVAGAPHFNFSSGLPNGSPTRNDSGGAHGTSAAGLIAAVANNGQGMSGVAPAAHLAAWVIYDSSGRSVSTERIGDMFRYASNVVSIQNHSWTPTGTRQRGPDALEDAGMASAWTQGRGGLGTVMVFAAGNDRELGGYVNDNGYASDPRAIGVAGVTPYGRATAASEPGSSLLVAAPTGDDQFGGLFTTDLSGTDGGNFISFCPSFEYLSDYRWGSLGFKHTSAAAPLVSGVAALVLSDNPGLTARDVQQVLLLSASHADLADPDLRTNAAGLAVSHNVGFGLVNAGEAVRLAQSWSNRPPVHRLTRAFTGEIPIVIPDGGYRVEVTGESIPPEVALISGIPGFGIQPDHPMVALPVTDIGRATNAPSQRLDGRGALIERGDISYDAKLATAAAAGAQFAIVYNLETAAPNSCPGGDQLCVPVGTDYSPIPVIFIGRTAGLALRDWVASNPDTRVRIALNGPSLPFSVTESWQCERVAVRLRTDFTVRGDLRVTLTSPSGTTSILQRYNGDTSPGPVDWTYWSTHYYYEPSAGTWTLSVTDEALGEGTGQILEASLILEGVPILDNDHDGLDDSWELTHLGTVEYAASEDPDGDGYSILRESLEGSNPLVDERSTLPDIGFFNDQLVRLSWPGRFGEHFRVQSGGDLGNWAAPELVPGRFPVTSTVLSEPASDRGFFSVQPILGPVQ